MADPLWKGAQQDLLVRVQGAPADPCLWEHAERVAHTAQALTTIPELKGRAIERAALALAALYHDGAWILQIQSGNCHPRDLLLKPTSDLQREMAANWLIERATPHVGAAIAQHAARIVRQMNNRRTDLLEARILADAENLDAIGPHSVCVMMRKIGAEGKTLADLTALWQRQNEYKYWTARIKDGFHFESTRRLAQTRLQKLTEFMDDLTRIVRLEDLRELGGVPETKIDASRDVARTKTD
jgi:hypothetical protein